MFRIFRILIDFPALDRLLDFLERNDRTQQKIDASTQRIRTFTAALKAAVNHEEK